MECEKTTSTPSNCVQISKKRIEHKLFKRNGLQYVIALTVSLIFVVDGCQSAWAGPTILNLKESNALVSDEEISWLASSNSLGYTLGPLLGAIGGKYLGRRRCILLASGPIIFGILLTAFVDNIAIKCVGLFVAGVGIASAYTISPLYIAEISSPEIRGRLTYFLSIGFNFGLFFEYAVGAYTSILVNGIIIVTIPILFFILFWWMPESPYFLLMKGKEVEAVNVLKMINEVDRVDEKIDSIKTFIKEQESREGILELFRSKCNRKALFITLGIVTAKILTGMNAILAYAPTIFSAGNSGFSVSVSSMIFAASGILVIGVTSLLVDTWGRKPLLLLSTISTAIPLLILGTYFYLQHINFAYLSSIALTPVITVILAKLLMSLGLGHIQSVFMGELFPATITPVAACVIESYGSIGRFGITKSYQFLIETLTLYGVFWAFGVCCIISTILLALFVPETKNKSLETIREQLKGKSRGKSLCV